MAIDDQFILNLFKTDFEKGFEILFSKYYKSLVINAYKITTDLGYAEDIVQEVVYKFIRKHAYRHIDAEHLSGYLFRATRNEAINFMLSRKSSLHRESIILDDSSSEPILYDDTLISALKQNVEKLPPQTRKILIEVYWNGRKYQEVSELYDISINTVKTLLKNGLKSLRQSVKNNIELFLLFIHPF